MAPDDEYGVRIAQLTKWLLEGGRGTRADIAVFIPSYRDVVDMTATMDRDFETLERAGLRIGKEGIPLQFSLSARTQESNPDRKEA